MLDKPTGPAPGDEAREPTHSTTPDMWDPPLERGAIPARIGRYEILRIIGQGGMGTVFEARQDQPRRLVALKVIRSGFVSPQSLRRFEHESQVLGRLQHPGIAQVYEAGMVPDEHGVPTPFFAMEFINGRSLTVFADEHALDIRARLELIARVCDAVYHAHQKGVVHRDLKPGNILVEDSGQPKILDFGVARATDSDLQLTTPQTHTGQLIGTVPYMSPEQINGDPAELDTRSDVYALGVIAYELLCGRAPYDLKRKVIHEAARIIREEEPTRLSAINRALRGDVETIVGKALEKDKTRRYQSAEALASDIRRFLRDEPIAARPTSAWYQTVKFTRRHRALVTGVAASFILLSGGLVATGISRQQAIAARNAESAALEQAQTLNDRLTKQRDDLRNALDAVTEEIGVYDNAGPDVPPLPAETGEVAADGSDPRIKQLGQYTLTVVRSIRRINSTLRSSLESIRTELEDSTGVPFDIPEEGDTESEQEPRIAALANKTLEAIRRINITNTSLQDALVAVTEEVGETERGDLSIPELTTDDNGLPIEERPKVLADFTIREVKKLKQFNNTLETALEMLNGKLQEVTGESLDVPEVSSDSEEADEPRILAIVNQSMASIDHIKSVRDTVEEVMASVSAELENDGDLGLQLLPEGGDSDEPADATKVRALGVLATDVIKRLRSLHVVSQQALDAVEEQSSDMANMSLDESGADDDLDPYAPRIRGLGALMIRSLKRARRTEGAVQPFLAAVSDELQTVSGLEWTMPDATPLDDESDETDPRIASLMELTLSAIRALRDVQQSTDRPTLP